MYTIQQRCIHTLEIQGSFPPVSPAHREEVVILSLSMAVCTVSKHTLSTQSHEHPVKKKQIHNNEKLKTCQL